MTDSSTYRIKLSNPIVVLTIGLAIAAVGTVDVFFPDVLDARTGIGRTAQRLAPLFIPGGLVMVAQSLVRIRRRVLKVDGSAIHSPFHWSMARGTVPWSNVLAIEPVGAPYGSKRGLRVRAREGPGTVIPLNLLEDGEQLEEDLRKRLADQQGPSPHDK
ncbi:MAG: hypothetical protein GY788_14690 [bacterium]|nr:hypothetical protein [bacterium]